VEPIDSRHIVSMLLPATIDTVSASTYFN